MASPGRNCFPQITLSRSAPDKDPQSLRKEDGQASAALKTEDQNGVKIPSVFNAISRHVGSKKTRSEKEFQV